MDSKFFKVHHKSKKSGARVGKIVTSHGVIQTPAFVPVATKGTLKSLTPEQIKEIGLQVAFVNCYHLVTHPGVEVIEKAGRIHNFSKLPVPLMSDSGGFQVFSLAGPTSPSLGARRRANVFGEEQPLVEKISEDGVKFRSTYDGTLIEFTPEKSIDYQKKIGADLIMAFDECLDCGADHKYAKKSMERTHEWLKRCLKQFRVQSSAFSDNANGDPTQNAKRRTRNQFLYGIIQGGRYEDLRKESAKFVTNQNTAGVAIGGVSVGETKEEMREQVSWVSKYLPEDRPVHLLGVGHADDILDLVGYGIDTFDCVEPTRLARMGTIYQLITHNPQLITWDKIDINKTIYKDNLERVDENCECYVCQNFTKAYLYHLFKQKELLGYTLATYHNLWVMEKFMESIRGAIKNNVI